METQFESDVDSNSDIDSDSKFNVGFERPHRLALRLVLPWVKLYKDDIQGSGTFIADVAFDIDAYSGQAEFWLPDSAAPGQYFLAGMLSLLSTRAYGADAVTFCRV